MLLTSILSQIYRVHIPGVEVKDNSTALALRQVPMAAVPIMQPALTSLQGHRFKPSLFPIPRKIAVQIKLYILYTLSLYCSRFIRFSQIVSFRFI